MAVTATDVTGNTAEQTIAFTVTASSEDLAEMLDQSVTDAAVAQRAVHRLQAHLSTAERHAEAGRTTQSVQAIDRFIATVEQDGNVTDDRAAQALVAVAQAWRDQLTPN